MTFDAKSVAAEFVRARRTAGSLAHYPGTEPADLDSAYRCQDEAITLWNDAVAGWKVGWIPEPLSEKYGTQRLVGPIFKDGIQRANGIGVAGPTRHERNAGLAGQPPVRVGHVYGGGLVADVDEIEAGVERGIEDRHDVVAGEGEHALAAEALERVGYNVGAAQRLAHIGFSPRPITGRRLWRWCCRRQRRRSPR